MSKRPSPVEAPPPAKKLALAPLDIGPATGEEDLNVKVLQVRVALGVLQLE